MIECFVGLAFNFKLCFVGFFDPFFNFKLCSLGPSMCFVRSLQLASRYYFLQYILISNAVCLNTLQHAFL